LWQVKFYTYKGGWCLNQETLFVVPQELFVGRFRSNYIYWVMSQPTVSIMNNGEEKADNHARPQSRQRYPKQILHCARWSFLARIINLHSYSCCGSLCHDWLDSFRSDFSILIRGCVCYPMFFLFSPKLFRTQRHETVGADR
jgi:hypothetical protein